MKVIIKISDLDLDYAKNLARKLETKFNEVEFKVSNLPNYLASKEDYLIDLYCPEQFPEFKPQNDYLQLHYDNPFAVDKDKLYRFSPVDEIYKALKDKLDKNLDSFRNLNNITSFIITNYNKDIEALILDKILATDTSAQKFLLNLGPNYLFKESPHFSKKNTIELLLALALNKFNVKEFGHYLEPSPLSLLIKRLRLAKHPDDLLLSDIDSIRKVIEAYTEFLNKNFDSSWRLYILSVNMSHQCNQLLASKSKLLYIQKNHNLREDNIYLKEIIANLAKNTKYKFIAENVSVNNVVF